MRIILNGGTGSPLTDPGADRIGFWDDSAGVFTWLTVGAGLTLTATTLTSELPTSNVVWHWQAQVETFTDVVFGLYEGTDLTPIADSNPDLNYRFMWCDTTAYQTVLAGKFKKISGISTLTALAQVWGGDAIWVPSVQVDVGGETVVISAADDIVAPAWQAPGTIDVSGLSDGTIYDITIGLKSNQANTSACLGSIYLLGS